MLMCARLMKVCLSIGLLLISFSSFSAIEVHEFDNEVDRKRYQTFIDEMRCPKCQNQNLAGTNSPIAVDLRRELDAMIKDGKSDKEIIDFMVARYGEYILYRPRLSPATILLWGAPVFLLIIGVVMLLLIVRKRRWVNVMMSSGLSQEEKNRLDNLLNRSKQNDAEVVGATTRQEKN
ncbi:cytochrome c-type biogenesis protein [Cellvibrio sp. NN19]|uniref:cytochrome c-type biogenesis protein n=1 Tax=Cellvibrio chitinivorans TaxID=3102792 RepID=UPI002B4027F2|nr:cytochrome c-type biogenesis protein [Cellvibrio sp. NN19]